MVYTFNTELKSVAFTYARLMNIKIRQSTLAKAQEENPAFPSLLSLSDVFSKYRVDNAAVRVSKDNFMDLSEQTPFVAYIKTSEVGLDFVVVDSIRDGKVGLYHKGRKLAYLPYEEFVTRYRDVVWKIFDPQNGGELESVEERARERVSLFLKILCVATLIGSVAVLLDINRLSRLFIENWLVLFLKIFGVAVSVLLLTFEVDKNNSFVKNICALNGKTNCDAVLCSKGSGILGVSWAK